MPDPKASGNSMQNYQPACSLDQTAVLQSQFVPMKVVLFSHWFSVGPWSFSSLFSSDASVAPIRRKTPLLGQLLCLFLATTACCHPLLGFQSSDITHLCAPRDNFPLPCSDEGLCRHHLHLPLCRSCSEHFSWVLRFLYSSRGKEKNILQHWVSNFSHHLVRKILQLGTSATK